MPETYRVRDWDSLYENSETRKLKKLSWVPIPNRHDGKGYRRLLASPEGPGSFGAWILILEVASRCPTRGVLVDTDGPIDSRGMADKTGYPEKLFKTAFKLLSS